MVPSLSNPGENLFGLLHIGVHDGRVVIEVAWYSSLSVLLTALPSLLDLPLYASLVKMLELGLPELGTCLTRVRTSGTGRAPRPISPKRHCFVSSGRLGLWCGAGRRREDGWFALKGVRKLDDRQMIQRRCLAVRRAVGAHQAFVVVLVLFRGVAGHTAGSRALGLGVFKTSAKIGSFAP